MSAQRFVLNRVGNPVLEWELLQRRKSKAYVGATRIVYGLYSLLVFTSTALVLFMVTFSIDSLYYVTTEKILKTLFFGVAWLPICAVFLVVPVFGASSVVGERRSQTLELVQLSLLRPFDIVWGKVVASITPILSPVVTSAFTFMLLLLLNFFQVSDLDRLIRQEHVRMFFDAGAISLVMAVVVMAVVVMAVVLTVSALSVLISVFAKSSAVAVTVSYGMTFMLFLYSAYLYVLSYSTVRQRYSLSLSIQWTVYWVVVTAVLSCAAGLFIRWACKGLRLPVVSTSAKSSAAAIPMNCVAVTMSQVVAFTLFLLFVPLLTSIALEIPY